jgi:hypothetical protein
MRRRHSVSTDISVVGESSTWRARTVWEEPHRLNEFLPVGNQQSIDRQLLFNRQAKTGSLPSLPIVDGTAITIHPFMETLVAFANDASLQNSPIKVTSRVAKHSQVGCRKHFTECLHQVGRKQVLHRRHPVSSCTLREREVDTGALAQSRARRNLRLMLQEPMVKLPDSIKAFVVISSKVGLVAQQLAHSRRKTLETRASVKVLVPDCLSSYDLRDVHAAQVAQNL